MAMRKLTERQQMAQALKESLAAATSSPTTPSTATTPPKNVLFEKPNSKALPPVLPTPSPMAATAGGSQAPSKGARCTRGNTGKGRRARARTSGGAGAGAGATRTTRTSVENYTKNLLEVTDGLRSKGGDAIHQ